MNIQTININQLKPATYNPRKNLKKGDSEYEKIKNSILEFGYIDPIICNSDFTIIGGHQRFKVLKDLNFNEIQCVVLDLDKTREKALNIALNKISGEFDIILLKDLIQEIDTGEINIELTGFDLSEIENMMSQFNINDEVVEDDFDIPNENEIQTDIKIGDLFEIGEHRLLCGDSTDEEQVKRLMNGQKADMVFTDPPYGENINFSYLGWQTKQKHKNEIIKNDNLDGENLETFLNGIASNIKLFNKGAYYICSGYKQLPIFQNVFEHNMLIVWNKKQLGFGMGDYRNQLEFILYSKGKGKWYGDNSQRNIWEINRENDNKLHPTIKPIELLTIPLQNNSKENDLVLDFFLGSGSTMVASHQLKRKCYGMELEPKYCQVIIDRMKKLDSTLIIKKNGIEI